MKFLIEHGDLWWRPNAGGYTRNLADAGLYSKDQADRIAGYRRVPRDIPVPLADKREELLAIRDGAQRMLDELGDVVVTVSANTQEFEREIIRAIEDVGGLAISSTPGCSGTRRWTIQQCVIAVRRVFTSRRREAA